MNLSREDKSIKKFVDVVVEFLEKRSVRIENIVYDRWKFSNRIKRVKISLGNQFTLNKLIELYQDLIRSLSGQECEVLSTRIQSVEKPLWIIQVFISPCKGMIIDMELIAKLLMA